MDHVGEFHALQPFQKVRELLVNDHDHAVYPVERRLDNAFPCPEEHVGGPARGFQGDPGLESHGGYHTGTARDFKQPLLFYLAGTAMLDPGHLADMDFSLLVLNDPIQVGDTYVLVI